jgi:hypothetical protein
VEEPVDSPGFSKPAHGYGVPFGTAPGDSDENWAGAGFTGAVTGPGELEPVDDAA